MVEARVEAEATVAVRCRGGLIAGFAVGAAAFGTAHADAQTWVTGPPRPEAASESCAAVLSTGDLWMAGGEGGSSALEGAYLLDGATGTWQPVTELNLGRSGATATVFGADEVLIVGGAVPAALSSTERVSTAAVEIYDAVGDVSTTLGPLPAPRDEHTATRLLDGRVLIVGGRTRALVGGSAVDSVLGTTLLFDPLTRSFTAGPSLGTPRRRHVAQRLADGRVLIFLGTTAAGASAADVEVFDPSSGSLSIASLNAFIGVVEGSGVLRNDRLIRVVRRNGAMRGFDTVTMTPQFPAGLTYSAGAPGAALLWDDTVLFAGGATSGGPAGALALSAGDVTSIPAGVFAARSDATVARLPSGDVVAAGGRGASGLLADTAVFVPSAPVVLEGLSAPPMPRSSALHRAVLLRDGRVLVVGGDAMLYGLYDRAAATWSQPPLPTGLALAPAVATLGGGKVLVAGGSGTMATSAALLFDPATTSWAHLVPMASARSGHTATTLDSGEVLVAGGGPQVAEVFDPEAETWRATSPMLARREGHTATRLRDGRVLIAGGTANGLALAAVEIYSPVTGTFSAASPMAGARTAHAAVLLPSGEVMVAGGNRGGVLLTSVELWSPTTGTWRAGPALGAARAGAVMQVMADDAVVIAGGLGPGALREQASERLSALGRRWSPVATPSTFVRGAALAGLLEPDGRLWIAGGVSAQGSVGALVERLASTSVSRPITASVPAFAAPGSVLAIAGADLIAPTEGHSGRSTAVASDRPIARLFTVDGAFVARLRLRDVTSAGASAVLPSVPAGVYMAIVTTAGRSAGGLVRVGNRAPVARPLAVTTAEDTPAPVTLAGGDRDADSLTFMVTQPPARGVISGSPPSLTYTPNADAVGADSLRYRVSDGIDASAEVTVAVTVTPVNDPPVGVADAYATEEDTPLVVSALAGLLANDHDVDSTALTVVAGSIAGPANGTVAVQPDGSLRYAPAPDFWGPDRFTYRVSDGAAESEDVEVTVEVSPVDDPPVARPDGYVVDEDAVLLVGALQGVLGNDVDVDSAALTAALVAAPARGVLALDPTGALTYTPEPDDFGPVTFRYVVSDGAQSSATATVTIDVRGVQDAPVAAGDEYRVPDDGRLEVESASGVLANDRDVDREPLTARLLRDVEHGVLELRADGGLRYVADPGFQGDDSFTYEARDRLIGSSPANVRLRVRPTLPVAMPDRYAGEEDVAIVVAAEAGLLANDVGANLAAVLVRGPASGTLDLRPDGSFTFAPAADLAGTLTFTYRAVDGLLESEVTAVTIELAPQNDPPPIPRPLVPADGAALTSGAVSFGWQSVRDVDGDLVAYRLVVRGPSGSPLAVESVDPFLVLSSERALPPGRYEWTVEAVDATGAPSGPSPALTFTVTADPGGAAPDPSGCGCSTGRAAPEVAAWMVCACAAALWARRRSGR